MYNSWICCNFVWVHFRCWTRKIQLVCPLFVHSEDLQDFMIADTISNAFERTIFFNECLKLNIAFLSSSCFSTTFSKAPLRLGSHGQLIEAIIVDSIFNQWCLKQNPHPMFLWLLLAMRHTFPTICPLNILWAALLLQSHQFLHRTMETEREREWERDNYYSGLLQFVPMRIRVWNNCPPPPVSSDNYTTKPFECFIFFSFHWFILSLCSCWGRQLVGRRR